MKDIFITSSSEEYFNGCEEYASKEEAIELAKKEHGLNEGESFYVGKKKSFTLHIDSGSDFLEYLIERNIDDLGDYSECWVNKLMNNKELHKKIDEKLSEISDLIHQMQKPDFYLVDEVEECIVNQGEASE